MDLELLNQRLAELDGILEQRPPDPGRPDWAGFREPLDRAEALAVELLAALEGETLTVAEDERESAREAIIYVAGSTAALLEAAGRSRPAKALLERCRAAAPTDEASVYEAGLREPLAFARLYHARWLYRRDDHREEARAVARTLGGADPLLAKLALPIADAPDRLGSAPELFTLNGFGVRVYGRGRRWPDGSYVTTRFVTALFVPVFPVDAYRVHDADQGWYFVGRVPLSRAMRIWRWSIGALLVLGLAWFGIDRYLESPERQLGLAMDEVAELEGEDPEAALRRYEELASRYALRDVDEDQLEALAAAWSRLATREIDEPVRVDARADVMALVHRFEALPATLTAGAPAEPFVAKLLTWAEQLGAAEASEAAADLRLELLEAALRFASGEQQEEAEAAARAIRHERAAALVEDWPLEALRHYGELGDDAEALAAIAAIVEELPDDPTLFADVGPELSAWAQRVEAGGHEQLHGARDRARDQLERAGALAADSERAELLASDDFEALRAAHEADPKDQALAAALAARHRARGELEAAAGILDALGEPGLTTYEVQYLRAAIAFDRGELDRAAERLEHMMSARLPAFEAASRTLDRELDALEERLIERAERGSIPGRYAEAITGSDAQAQQAAFSAWLEDSVDQSIELSRLRETYMRSADVVPVALLLGSVQLERARRVSGEPRQRLLDDAERTFLAIRGAAAGTPDYHASLGQVKFQLGKPEEGEAELQVLIDSGEPEQMLAAAHVYRVLHRSERARAVAEQVYGEADEPQKSNAALLLALTAVDLDDKEKWLRRVDFEGTNVKSNLLEVEGERLRLAGEFAAADRKFAESVALHLDELESTPSAANNAAVGLRSRYRCTGDRDHLERAQGLLERALAERPQDGIVAFNYAEVVDFRAQLAVLDEFAPARSLRVSSGQAELLLEAIAGGDQGEALRAVVRDSSLRQRALDAQRRLRSLSPGVVQSYEAEIGWLMLADDDAALAELAERLEQPGAVETADAAQTWASYLAGDFDELALAEVRAELRGREALREELGARARAPVRGALHYLDGVAHEQLAELEGSLAEAQAAVAAYERAHEAWPGALSTARLSRALLAVALFEIGEEREALGQRWRTAVRASGTSSFIVELLEADDPALAELKAHPAVARALELRRGVDERDLDPSDLVLAMLVGDAELKARARRSLATTRARSERRIGVAISPYDENIAELGRFIDGALEG